MNVLLLFPRVAGIPHVSYPPLGLGHIAAAAEEAGHHVKLIDLHAENMTDESLLQTSRDFAPDVIGIGFTIASRNDVQQLASKLGQARIVFGGPEPTTDPDRYLTKDGYIVVRGEGEVTFVELLGRLSAGAGLSSVRGISYRENDAIRHNPNRAMIADLNTLQRCAWHQFKLDLYEGEVNGQRAINLISSRGCPYHCIYCLHALFGKEYRARDARAIVDEMEYLQRTYGYRGFFMFDDLFMIDRKSLNAFCDELIRRRLNVSWRCFTRVNIVHEDTLALMKRSGCVNIFFGVESGSERSLKLMKKGIRLEDIHRGIALSKGAGIETSTFLLIGFPWETKEDFEATRSLVCEVLPDTVLISFATPVPKTEFSQIVVDHGIAFDHESGDYVDMTVPAYETGSFSKDDLVRHRDRIYESFHRAQIAYVLRHPLSDYAKRWYRRTRILSQFPGMVFRRIKRIARRRAVC
jgi:anaerobic magnesium-protoporphyrin IX monomethyl ester cyclase